MGLHERKLTFARTDADGAARNGGCGERHINEWVKLALMVTLSTLPQCVASIVSAQRSQLLQIIKLGSL